MIRHLAVIRIWPHIASMRQIQKFHGTQFIARPAKDGKSWSVFCEMGFQQPLEIPDFSSEKAAQYWIDVASKSWLEKYAVKDSD